MHPEIEKLIDLALADGQITDKERNVILKKAIALGIDEDEIEMIVEAKIHKFHSSKKENSSDKIENIKKCPSCGNIISGLSKTCICGYVINTGSIIESKSLEASIESLENLIVQVRGLSSSISKEIIESLIARVEKEIRYIKTRYADNYEVKKLLAELEILSSKYIKKAVNKKKRRMLIISIIPMIVILFYGYSFIKSRMIRSEKFNDNFNFTKKLDSISNPKLKEYIRNYALFYKNWDNFKDRFFSDYPDYSDRYVNYLENKYKFSEQMTYKIAENQFNQIKIKFKNPIDFILFDDRNNFRTLSSTSQVDSVFILKLISKNRWDIKRTIDNKIELIQNTELASDLKALNDVDSVNQSGLIHWNEKIKNFILQEQNGSYPRLGFVKVVMKDFRIDEKLSKQYCDYRLQFFEKKFREPIDFFNYRDNLFYNNGVQDKDDYENAAFLMNKFNIKDQ